MLEQIDIGCSITSLSWSPNYRTMALGSSKVMGYSIVFKPTYRYIGNLLVNTKKDEFTSESTNINFFDLGRQNIPVSDHN